MTDKMTTYGKKVEQKSLTRELAALVGGPWSGAWYWRDELETIRTNDHCDPAFATYRRTERRIENPDPELKGVWGQVWEPVDIAVPLTIPGLATSRTESRTWPKPVIGPDCIGCGQRLLLAEPGRDRCERCLLAGGS